jgi:hypothetical protein
MMQTPVTDGSFEDVPASELNTDDASSGGWILSGPNAYFESNNFNLAYQTPYGSIFVTFYGCADINSVSQPLTFASCNSVTYTLSYSYNARLVESLGGDYCILSVTYGGVTIDSAVITDYTAGWLTRTQVFTPATSSGTISFNWDCTALYVNDEIDLLLDNISIN